MGKLQFRLATSRLANTFGNGTVYRHDKKIERVKTPEMNRINRAPKARASFEVPKARFRPVLRSCTDSRHATDNFRLLYDWLTLIGLRLF